VLPLLTALTQGWAIGWASAPYDPYWAARYPKRAALMAAAGPFGNLILATTSFALLKVGLGTGMFVAPSHVSFSGVVEAASAGLPEFAAVLLSIFLMLNVLLFAFNLLPLPPLDGAAVLGLVLPRDQAIALQQYTHQPWIQILGIAIAWKFFPLLSSPLFAFVLALLHPAESYH